MDQLNQLPSLAARKDLRDRDGFDDYAPHPVWIYIREVNGTTATFTQFNLTRDQPSFQPTRDTARN